MIYINYIYSDANKTVNHGIHGFYGEIHGL